jgi:transcription antitermination protein NusB
MQALYAFEQGGGEAQDVIHNVLKPSLPEADAPTLRFAERLFLRTLDHTSDADALIQARVKNWEVERIALVDHILLRMAVTEFLAFDDIPPKVSINEAIEIAKRYSTHRSGQFVNGLLDGILLNLMQEGRVNKSGRGLVGMPQPGARPAPAEQAIEAAPRRERRPRRPPPGPEAV